MLGQATSRFQALPPPLPQSSLKVANTGSTARDHLANERTFLAWMRTSISLLALGLAIAKFLHGGLLFGTSFIVLGAIFFVYSGRRYFEVMQALRRDEYEINTGGIIVLLGLTGAVALACIIVVIANVAETS